jgi:hypothetical protein
VWLEPSPEFAEFNRIAQEMRKYFLPEAQQPAKPGSQAKSQAQPKAQTKTNTNANNATSFQPPSAAETKQYEERILPKDVPLEDTPHYKMFVVEFAETLRNNFQDVEFAIEDHTTLLWLYLLHMCTIADNNRYRVSLSELPELFREFYHKKLDLPQKLVTTLQEDCYLVCQVEKFKNDLHVKPSDELVHFLDSDVGYALQDVIAENLMAVQDRYEMLSWDESDDEDDEQSTNNDPENTQQPNNDSTVQKQSNNAPAQNIQQSKNTNNTANNSSAQSTPLILNGADIGTYGNKGRELAMKEHLEKERQKAEQVSNNKHPNQAQRSKSTKPAQPQQYNPVGESKNKTAAKERNKSPAQYVKKGEPNSSSPNPAPKPTQNPSSTHMLNNNNSLPAEPKASNSQKAETTTKQYSGVEELADTVHNEFTCGMCNQILRRPVEANCCHKLVCYTCSLFTPQCPFCRRRVTWAQNHVVDHLMTRLTVQCTYKGCDEWVPLGDTFIHKDHCEHKPMPCPNKGCSASKHFSELDAHIDTCPFGIIDCECKQQVKRRNLEEHRATCKKRHGKCQKCHKAMSHAELQKHACSSLVKCPFDCDSQIEQSALDAHLNQLVNCPNYGCPAVIKHRDVPAHRNSCEYGKSASCANGCGWQGAVKDLSRHTARCKNRK